MGSYDELMKTGTEFSMLLSDQASEGSDTDKKVSARLIPAILQFDCKLERLPENSFQHYLVYIAEQASNTQTNKINVRISPDTHIHTGILKLEYFPLRNTYLLCSVQSACPR